MDNFLQMVDTQSVLFLYMAVGFLCQRLGILDGHTQEKLTGLVIKFMMPCMVFESFHMELGLEALRDGGVILLIATVMAAISLLLGKVLYLPFPPEDRSVLQYGTLVTNSGFAGLPLVSSAYGSEGLFLGSLFVIPTRILMWSAGISLFTRASGREAVKKVLLNPSILAVELGLARMLLQIPLPHFLDTAVSILGGCTSPLAMALVGGAPGGCPAALGLHACGGVPVGGAADFASAPLPGALAAPACGRPHDQRQRGAHGHAYRFYHGDSGTALQGKRLLRLQVCVCFHPEQFGHDSNFDNFIMKSVYI